MFASTMAQQAAKGEHMGLNDLILRSIEKKQSLAAGNARTPANGNAAPATSDTAAPITAAVPAASGFPLAAYWGGKGMRPLRGCHCRRRRISMGYLQNAGMQTLQPQLRFIPLLGRVRHRQ